MESELPKPHDLYTDDGGTVFRWWKDKAIALQLIDLFHDQRRRAIEEFLNDLGLGLMAESGNRSTVWNSSKDRTNVWTFL